MGARQIASQQAWLSLSIASVGVSQRSLDDDPRRLGALKRRPPSRLQAGNPDRVDAAGRRKAKKFPLREKPASF
jgi:hypothetical protein